MDFGTFRARTGFTYSKLICFYIFPFHISYFIFHIPSHSNTPFFFNVTSYHYNTRIISISKSIHHSIFFGGIKLHHCNTQTTSISKSLHRSINFLGVTSYHTNTQTISIFESTPPFIFLLMLDYITP
jgi:hypothetical protein